MARNTRYRSGSNWPAGIGPKVTALHSVVGRGVIPIIVAERESDAQEEQQEAKDPEVIGEVTEEPRNATPVMIHKAPTRKRSAK